MKRIDVRTAYAIANHKADLSAHHAKYTNAEAVLGLYEYGGIYWQIPFNSSDAFEQDIVGSGAIEFRQEYVKLKTGTVANDYTAMYKMPYLPLGSVFSWDKMRRIKTRFAMAWGVDDCEVWLNSGMPGIDGVPARHIGFKIVNGLLSGVTGNGTDESTLALKTITISDKPEVEAVLNPGIDCRFFVDGVYKGAITEYLPAGTLSSSTLAELYIKTATTAQKIFVVSEWRFLQEP